MISGYPGSGMISATENPEMEMYTSRGVGPDDDGSTGGGASSKDKGRGSYKCGRVSAALVMSYSLAVV